MTTDNPGTSLVNSTKAAATLQQLNVSISKVSAQRDLVGASVIRLTSANAVVSAEVRDLTSASDAILDADTGKVIAQAAQDNILQSTGMFALQEASEVKKAILKLIQ